ncbi:MAG: sigma-70 family RNA polymerase sigma factor [Proteobacteria bacterium]|nr:sigma-70 family RNA polymerase sigma factor [Pseudomonadota bacterium]
MMVGTMKAVRAEVAGVDASAVSDHLIASPEADAASSAAQDKALIAKVRSGNGDAYRTLVEKYQKRAYLLAIEIVRSPEDAKDVVQESFVKAYLSLRDFKQDSTFYTWLYRIVHNMAIDYRRKMARRGGAHIEFDERTLQGISPKGEENAHGGVLENRVEGPQEALLRKEREQKLRAVLKELSEEHRIAITLREVDGLSYDEIAEVTGVARGTVMSRLFYARKRIQAAFQGD